MANKLVVKLKVRLEFLETLPAFTPAKVKRVKKIATEDKKSTTGSSLASRGSTPGSDNLPQRTAPKDYTTSGLMMNSLNQLLDRSGNPAKKWVRSPRKWKTFSGFKLEVKGWRSADMAEKGSSAEAEPMDLDLEHEPPAVEA